MLSPCSVVVSLGFSESFVVVSSGFSESFVVDSVVASVVGLMGGTISPSGLITFLGSDGFEKSIGADGSTDVYLKPGVSS